MKLNIRYIISFFAGILGGTSISEVLFSKCNSIIFIMSLIVSTVLFSFLTYQSFYKLILVKLSHFTLHKKVLILGFLYLLGFATYLMIPLYEFVQGSFIIKLVAGLGIALLFSIIYSIILITALFRNGNGVKTEKLSLKTFMIWFISFFIICIVYVLVYYPGVMSSDTFEQWKQMSTFKFNDWHPAFSTILNWVVTRPWNSPVAIALFNSVIFSLVFAIMVTKLKNLGADKKILFPIALLFVLNPVNGIMAVTLWKDLPYSVSLLWLTYILFSIFYSEGRWMKSWPNNIIFIISMIFSALIRHNGLAPVVMIFIALLLFYRKYWLNIGIATILTFAIIIIIKGPVYDMLNITPLNPFQSLVNPIMQVGGIVSGNGIMSDKERKIVNEILPLDEWKIGYQKYSEVPLASRKNFNIGYFKTNKKEFLITWASLAVKNPHLAVNAYLERTAIIWRISNPSKKPIYTNPRMITSNTLGFTTSSKISQLKKITDILLSTLDHNQLIWAFWKPATYMLIILLFGFTAVMKNGYKWLIVTVPVIGNTLGLMLITTSDQSRYYYITLITAPFIIVAALLPGIQKAKEEDENTKLVEVTV